MRAEPPDQGLCVGNGFVVEAVNVALIVYSALGTELTEASPLSQFFELPPEQAHGHPPPAIGPHLFDPRCYHDAGTDRWFLTVGEFTLNSSSGAIMPPTRIELAVSKTGDPRGAWNLFSIDAVDDGSDGTPNHPNCPCYADYPTIGADANGFYISTTEYSLSLFQIESSGADATASEFSTGKNLNGSAQIYAMSKSELAAGELPTVVHIDAGNALAQFGESTCVVQPATAPPGGSYAPDTEYFLSAFDGSLICPAFLLAFT